MNARQDAETLPPTVRVGLDGQDRQYFELRQWLTVLVETARSSPSLADVRPPRLKRSPTASAPVAALTASASE
jgi:hypothetical protein